MEDHAYFIGALAAMKPRRHLRKRVPEKGLTTLEAFLKMEGISPPKCKLT